MIYLILHNIRSAYNVGSIFRTADAAGVLKIYLTGFTPTPIDRFGRKRKDIQKSALGAEDTVAWEHTNRPGILIDKLKKEGVYIVGVEQSPEAVDYKTLTPLSTPPRSRLTYFSAEKLLFSRRRTAKCLARGVSSMRFLNSSRAYLFGNEIKGLSPQLLKKCTVVAEIPMHGKKESLNVAVAAGIILFRMID